MRLTLSVLILVILSCSNQLMKSTAIEFSGNAVYYCKPLVSNASVSLTEYEGLQKMKYFHQKKMQR
jgi:hypothetical protein